MATFSGVEFDLLNPTKEMVSIVDISWSLARTFRWNAHTHIPITVARHSINTSLSIVPEKYIGEIVKRRWYPEVQEALAALLHDAHEAYIGDISSPIKNLSPVFKEEIKKIELRIDKAIYDFANIPHLVGNTPKIKDADLAQLHKEWVKNFHGYEKPEELTDGAFDNFDFRKDELDFRERFSILITSLGKLL